jgi:hypothetical protein
LWRLSRYGVAVATRNRQSASALSLFNRLGES